MNLEDLRFAQDCVRGSHMILAAFKRWMAQRETTKQDAALVAALDRAAAAGKDWLRYQFQEMAPKGAAEQEQQNSPK